MRLRKAPGAGSRRPRRRARATPRTRPPRRPRSRGGTTAPGTVVEVAAGRRSAGQGERFEAVLLTHPVDGLAERHLAPAVVQGELEGVVRETAHAHPDEAHPAGADVELVEQRRDRLVERPHGADRERQRAAPAHGVERVEAHLERHRARRQALAAQLGDGVIGEREQRGAQEPGVVDVVAEGDLAADRLGQRPLAAHRREAAPQGELAQPVGAPAERRGEQREGHVLQHPDRGEAEGGEALLGDRPDAADRAHGQVAQTAMHVGGGELADAGRLVQAGGQLGQQLGGPDADGAGDGVRVVDLLLDAVGDGARRAEQPPAAGDVEVGLVDGRHLDEVGVLLQEIDQGPVDGEVGLHVDGQEHPVRAEPLGLRDGQRAVHPVHARLVGAGRDHAASSALAADDHRQAAQLGAARLLDRGEEGVHVEVEDCPG